MRFYEITFILRQDVQPQEVDSKVEKFINIIEENGGSVVRKELWGLRSLAHIVRKNKKGWYAMLVVEGHGELVREVEEHCKLSEDVIKYLTVRVDEKDVGSTPSPMVQSDDASPRTFVRKRN